MLCAMVAGECRAGYLPFGVQNDVALSTVTGGGWTQIYRGNYNENVLPSTMFGGAQQYLLIGAIRDDLTTIDVLAAALTTDVLLPTGFNAPHTANGAEWYYNLNLSIGFAGLGDTINQQSADTNGLAERDRLSWHASGGMINGGWRSGSNNAFNNGIDMNNSTLWDRIVFTANASDLFDDGSQVPEPASMALLAMGAFGFWGVGRRRKAVDAA